MILKSDELAHVKEETKEIKSRVKAALKEMDFEDLRFLDNIVENMEGYKLFFHVLNSNKL